MKKKIFMETTQISPAKTSGEIVALIVAAGASQIAMEYQDKKLSGLRFVMQVAPNESRPFALPVRVEPVFKILNGNRASSWDRTQKADRDHEQAERVAWRQLYRWCQAQIAMIDIGMVEVAEVFLPYMQDDSGRTLFEVLKDSGMKLLPAPKK